MRKGKNKFQAGNRRFRCLKKKETQLIEANKDLMQFYNSIKKKIAG